MFDAERAPRDLVSDLVVPIAVARFVLTAIFEFEPVDGGTRLRAIVRHGSAEEAAVHAEMGFEQGWGAALDQLVALFA